MGECDLTPGLQQATDFVCGCLCVFCFLISGDYFDKRANEERHWRLLPFNSLKIITTVPGLNRVDLTWFLWQRVVIRIVEISSCLFYTRDKAPRTNFNKLYFALNSTCDNVVRITLNINMYILIGTKWF